MSKGNLFLGMASGSVGDVTLYRTNGQQIARARNRRPSNPRSDAQLYQRAILATISRVYQLGHAIFDHSFQGYRRGAENQRRFQKLNLNALRAQLAADVAAGTSLARVGAPGVSAPTANRYIISEGTYQNTQIIPNADGSFMVPYIEESDTTVAQYAARVGLIDDDIFTVIGIGVSPTDFAYEYVTDDGRLVEQASLGRANFKFVQFRVKKGTQASTQAISDETPITDVFDVYATNFPYTSQTFGDSPWTFGDLVENPDWNNGAIGVIRSREDSDLRSNTTMQLVGQGTFGITARWLLTVWRKEYQIGSSDLILEGSEFAPASRSSFLDLTPGNYFLPIDIPVGNLTATNTVVTVTGSRGLVVPVISEGNINTLIAFDNGETDTSVDVTVAQQSAFFDAIVDYVNGRYADTEGVSPTLTQVGQVPAADTILGAL